MGRGRLQMLVEAGLVSNLPALLRLQEEDIAALPGFGERSARQFAAAIHAAGRPPLPSLLTALGIPGVGPATAKQLAEHFSTLESLEAADGELLATIPGISPTAAKNIRAFIASPGGRELLEEFREIGLMADAHVPAVAPAPGVGSGNMR
jgi:DNA ligase (NAD+)